MYLFSRNSSNCVVVVYFCICIATPTAAICHFFGMRVGESNEICAHECFSWKVNSKLCLWIVKTCVTLWNSCAVVFLVSVCEKTFSMNKTCARCEKTVYPTEELKCLDKVKFILFTSMYVFVTKHSSSTSVNWYFRCGLFCPVTIRWWSQHFSSHCSWPVHQMAWPNDSLNYINCGWYHCGRTIKPRCTFVDLLPN